MRRGWLWENGARWGSLRKEEKKKKKVKQEERKSRDGQEERFSERFGEKKK